MRTIKYRVTRKGAKHRDEVSRFLDKQFQCQTNKKAIWYINNFRLVAEVVTILVSFI